VTFIRIVQAALALGVLIFIHELGHFLAAKWAGVRVEVFSLGFGPFLFSFKKGQTVYALSLIPLGGYVRMTGQADVGPVKEKEGEPPPPDSYLAKTPLVRAVIIVAGVTMNAIFAYIVFVVALMVGFPAIPAEVGALVPGRPAEAAGLVQGDRILAVNGSPVDRFTTVYQMVATAEPGRPMEFLIERDGVTSVVNVAPVRDDEEGISTIGVVRPEEPVRLRIGAANAAGLGVRGVQPDLPAALAGLEAGDHIVAVNGEPFVGLEGLKAALRKAGGAPVVVEFRRGTEKRTVRVAPQLAGESPEGEPQYRLGFSYTTSIIGEVLPGSPAAAAGIVTGSFVTKIARNAVRTGAELAWTEPGGDQKSAFVGFVDDGPEFDAESEPKQIIIKCGFLAAWAQGGTEMLVAGRMIYNVLAGLVHRWVSPRKLAGIAQIGVIIYSTAKEGLGFYLWFIAIFSVNLAVLNLLPMLPFDGGLLAFLAYEGIRGKPANRRVMEVAQAVGLVLLLALIVFVTSNDITAIRRMFS